MKISKNQDAFGGEIYDYYKGLKGIHEIVERDDGFISTGGGPSEYFQSYNKWLAHQKKGMRFVRGKALDIGCGAGRVSLHLQQKGHDVLAVDNSPLALEVCRRRGVRKTRLLTITQITPTLGRFDTIIMYGNNFGLFRNYKRAQSLLKRFCNLTTEQGRIIAESCNPYLTCEPDHLTYHKFNKRRGRMPGQLRIRIRYKKMATPWFDYLLASPDEVKKIVDGTGWKIARTFETTAGPYVLILAKR